MRKLGKADEAKTWLEENLRVDPFDYVSMFEAAILQSEAENGKAEAILGRMNELMRDFHENYLQAARDYADAGCYEEAAAILEHCTESYPMLEYYKAYFLGKMGKEEACFAACQKADGCSPLYCFPNKLEDIAVLENAIGVYPQGAKAYYYLGSLFYDKLQFEKAAGLWEESVKLDGRYPTAHRNLALAYYNKQNDEKRAIEQMEQAFLLDQTDTRVFLELDQLYKKTGMEFEKRLANYEKNREILAERDDAMLEFVTLYNLVGKHQAAYDTIMSHVFRPWEGAEGRISGQYKIALVELAKEAIAEASFAQAEELLGRVLEYPQNLGEGRLEGTKDNHIYYYLGTVKKKLGKMEEAKECFQKAEMGEDEPAGAMYYYDQPADMILYKGLAHQELGKRKAAYACFNKLMDYGERHLYDEMKNDFFAVSLPDFLIFEDDMDKKNKAHCHYLMGLANLGTGKKEEAARQFEKALSYDYNHQNCRIYLKMAK